jgi:hypothetical protein
MVVRPRRKALDSDLVVVVIAQDGNFGQEIFEVGSVS